MRVGTVKLNGFISIVSTLQVHLEENGFVQTVEKTSPKERQRKSDYSFGNTTDSQQLHKAQYTITILSTILTSDFLSHMIILFMFNVDSNIEYFCLNMFHMDSHTGQFAT